MLLQHGQPGVPRTAALFSWPAQQQAEHAADSRYLQIIMHLILVSAAARND